MPAKTRRRRPTREALIGAALQMVEAGRSYASLSLREVTRKAGVVPTAFYRHFEDMDELGLTLVEQSSVALRQLMREARSASLPTEHIIGSSVATLFDFADTHRPFFLFLFREREGGSLPVREAINVTLRLFVADLATDLARMPPLRAFSTPDLHMLADLLTNTVATAVPEFLETEQAPRQLELRKRVERQLRLIALGAAQWRSRQDESAG